MRMFVFDMNCTIATKSTIRFTDVRKEETDFIHIKPSYRQKTEQKEEARW